MVNAFDADVTQVLYVPEFTSVIVEAGASLVARPLDPLTRTGGSPARSDGKHPALIEISSRTYIIRCGCAEADGKTCTIPRNTVVVWRFADSEEHDVSSASFGESGDRIAGDWPVTFSESGQFPYLCNIHSADMNGYTIVVQ